MDRKNKLLVFVMFLVGVAIFWHEAAGIDFSQLAQGVQSLKWGWLAVATICLVVSFFLEASALRCLIGRETLQGISRYSIDRIPWIEALFNAITPFSSGGQPAQLVGLLQIGIEGGRGSSILLMKFVIYQVMVLINFIITMFIGFHRVVMHYQGLAWLVVFGFTIHIVTIGFLLLIMFHYQFTKRNANRLFDFLRRVFKHPKLIFWQEKTNEKIETFHHESMVLKREKTKVIKASILTFLQLAIYYTIPYFILLALHASQVDIVYVFSMHVMIVMIVSIFPIPGGAGGAEYSFKTLFASFVPDQAVLLLGLFLWRFLTYYLGMIVGLIVMTVKPKSTIKSR